MKTSIHSFVSVTAAFFAAILSFSVFVFAGCSNPAGNGGDGANRVEIPVATPGAGQVAAGTTVILSTATAGAEICYTTDGSEPTSAGPKYDNSPISVSAALTIKAIAVKEGWVDSAAMEAAYTLSENVVAAPTANPPSGEAPAGTKVTLSTVTEGAAIYYTLDGREPDSTSIEYTEPIAIAAAATIKAFAIKAGMDDSAVLTAVYTIASAPADTTPPANVTGLGGTAGDGQATLSWIDPEDPDLASIEISWTGGSETVARSSAEDRANSKIIAGLINGTSYIFTIKAVDDATPANKSSGVSSEALTPLAPVDITPPANVTGLSGIAGDGQATLSWTDPEDPDLASIEISWTGGSETVARSSAGNRANSKIIAGLINGTSYIFTVKAVDNATPANRSSGVFSEALTPLASAITAGSVTVEFAGPRDESINLEGVHNLSWSANTALAVSVSGAFSAYRWDLDGVTRPEETGNSLALNAGELSVKRHTLTVFVTKDGVEYAKSVAFTVGQ
jgi:hypothetical protein